MFSSSLRPLLLCGKIPFVDQYAILGINHRGGEDAERKVNIECALDLCSGFIDNLPL